MDNVACVAGECHSNPCTDAFCGTGTCVLEDDPSTTDFEERAYCKCDEGSLSYERAFAPIIICTPECDSHSDCSKAYINEGYQVAGTCIKGQCNERNICKEDNDCPIDNICDDEQCKNKPIEE